MATNHSRPDPVGSGAQRSPGPPLPKFPNNVDLVQDESNTKLLQALLPALNKYKCLEVGVKKSGRSPFVRAFCDLYHPAGPWGRFSNVPDITSAQKWRFKSYKIPQIYKNLQRRLMQGGGGGGDEASAVHLELHEALHEYYSKEQYFKDFMAACEPIAATEANKPIAVRPTFPTAMESRVETGVATLVAAPQNTKSNSSATATATSAANGSDSGEAKEINNEDVVNLDSEDKQHTTETEVKLPSTPTRHQQKASGKVTPSPEDGIRRGTKRQHSDDDDRQAVDPPARNTRRRLKEKKDEDGDQKSLANLEDGASDLEKEGNPADKVQRPEPQDDEDKEKPSLSRARDQRRNFRESSGTMDDQENSSSTVDQPARNDERSEPLPSVVGSATPEETSSRPEEKAPAETSSSRQEEKGDNSDEKRQVVVKEEPKEEDPQAVKEEVGEESADDTANNNDEKKREIESRRAELFKVLQRRKSDGKDGSDPLCKKIEQKIDAEDEKLLELILLE